MELKYFSLSMSIESINKLKRKYALQHHPDKFTSESDKRKNEDILSSINSEYNFVVDEKSKNKESAKQATGAFDELLEKQAQNIFQALTNGKGVDYNLLIATLPRITDYTKLFEVYKQKYSIETIVHLQQKIKNKEVLKGIEDLIQATRTVENIKNIFKSW